MFYLTKIIFCLSLWNDYFFDQNYLECLTIPQGILRTLVFRWHRVIVFLDVYKLLLRLVIGFITGYCEIRSAEYWSICCDEKELKTVQHLLCKCRALGKMRLRTLSRGFFDDLNSVSRFSSLVAWDGRHELGFLRCSRILLFFALFGLWKCFVSRSPFPTSSLCVFLSPSFTLSFLRTPYNGPIRPPGIVLVSVNNYT